MLKKVIGLVILLCLTLNISVMAENTVQQTMPDVSQNMPRGGGERKSGGRSGMPPMGDRQGRGTPPSMPNGEMPSGDFVPPSGDFVPPSGDFVPPENGTADNNTKAIPPQTDAGVSAENPQSADNMMGENPPFGSQMPEGMEDFFANMQNNNQNMQREQKTGFWGFVKTNSTPVTSVVLLALAYVFVLLYKRKNY